MCYNKLQSMNKNDELKASDWRVKDTQPSFGEFWLAGSHNDKK